MSLENFYNEIRRFLRTPDPEVLIIAGKWGVGKTFTWNTLLGEESSNNSIALQRYAYVSLFGLSGLGDIKSAILQNTVPSDRAESAADILSVRETFTNATSKWRQGFSLARSVFTDYAALIDKIGFLLVSEQIVCIDDLERKSQGLDLRDVLGVISYLREQRACKIAVLLNDERLEGESEEFRMQLEKVADTTIRFQPTSKEAAAIGLSKDTSFHEKLTDLCVELGIINIRTIKKIERSALRLEEALNKFDRRVFDQALASLTLFQYAKFQPDVAPSLEFLRTMNPYDIVRTGNEQPPVEAEWRVLLQNYPFAHCDELDKVIMRGVEDGHFCIENLEEEAKKVHEQLLQQDQDNSFSESWRIYHDSFDDNADDLLKEISSAIVKTPKSISAVNLSGSIKLLKDLKWDGDISALLHAYISGRDDNKEFWNLAAHPFGGDVTDPDVRSAFDAKFASFADERNAAEILVELGKQQGWNQSDLVFLASLDADALYSIFKNARGDNLRRTVRGALLFRNAENGDQYMQALTSAAVGALRRIAAETPINRRRVQQLSGITLDDPFPNDGQDA